MQASRPWRRHSFTETGSCACETRSPPCTCKRCASAASRRCRASWRPTSMAEQRGRGATCSAARARPVRPLTIGNCATLEWLRAMWAAPPVSPALPPPRLACPAPPATRRLLHAPSSLRGIAGPARRRPNPAGDLAGVHGRRESPLRQRGKTGSITLARRGRVEILCVSAAAAIFVCPDRNTRYTIVWIAFSLSIEARARVATAAAQRSGRRHKAAGGQRWGDGRNSPARRGRNPWR